MVINVKEYVKKRPYLKENLPLKDWVKKQKEKKIKGLVERPPPDAEFEGLVDDRDPQFDGLIPDDAFFEDYSEADLEAILKEQDKVIRLLKKHGKNKYLANRILFVFDDLVGSELFNGRRDNVFKKL